jgi:hypothetical protein
MLRVAFLILISSGCLMAQFQFQWRWKCDAKDGKFVVRPGKDSKKFYCWDGQIFSEEKGYTPPPGYVLAYWEEVARKSAQMRADIERKGKEMAEQWERSKQETARLNQERMAEHKAYMDDLNRRVGETRRDPPVTRGSTYTPATSTARANPKTVVVSAPEPATPAPKVPPASRAKVDEVKTGMDRAAVESILGQPHGSMSIPEEDSLLEVLTYLLDDNSTARVRIKDGKVLSVKITE